MRNISDRIARIFRGHQFVRFVLVGVANTAFSYAVYAMLLYAGLNYVLANLGACLLGIMFSFRTQGVLVFRNPAWRPLSKYVAFWLLIYLCNIGLIKSLLSYGFNAYAAGALALAPIVALSFTLQKYVVFRQPVEKLSRV
jgi:putative flippase GtrA